MGARRVRDLHNALALACNHCLLSAATPALAAASVTAAAAAVDCDPLSGDLPDVMLSLPKLISMLSRFGGKPGYVPEAYLEKLPDAKSPGPVSRACPAKAATVG